MRIITTLALVAVAALGQLAPFPSWYRARVFTPPSQRARFNSIAWDFVHPDLVASASLGLTRKIRLGDYSFLGLSSSPVLAIYVHRAFGSRRHGGLDTSLFAVMSLDGPFDVEVGSQTASMLLIAGVARDAFSRVIAYVDRGTAPSPSNLVPLAFRGLPGEVFTAASWVDGSIYVVDGAAAKIIRFVDSDDDLVPDARDSGFAIDLTAIPPLTTFSTFPGGPILGFRSDSRAPEVVARVIYGGFWLKEDPLVPALAHDCIVRVGGASGGEGGMPGYSLQIRKSPHYLACEAALPDLAHGCPAAGQDRIQCYVLENTSVVVETSASDTGPWQAASEVVSVGDTLRFLTIDLAAPLVLGHFVRVRDVAKPDDYALQVQPGRPIIFSPKAGLSVENGQTVTIEGDNLDAKDITLTFDPGVGYAGSVAVPMLTQTKHRITFQANLGQYVPTVGYLILEKPGPLPCTAGFTMLLGKGETRLPR